LLAWEGMLPHIQLCRMPALYAAYLSTSALSLSLAAPTISSTLAPSLKTINVGIADTPQAAATSCNVLLSWSSAAGWLVSGSRACTAQQNTRSIPEDVCNAMHVSAHIVGVDVNLHKDELAIIRLAQLPKVGADHLAGSTPVARDGQPRACVTAWMDDA
jgi:hypothetical protein